MPGFLWVLLLACLGVVIALIVSAATDVEEVDQ